jgi:hypothetical protein
MLRREVQRATQTALSRAVIVVVVAVSALDNSSLARSLARNGTGNFSDILFESIASYFDYRSWRKSIRSILALFHAIGPICARLSDRSVISRVSLHRCVRLSRRE